MNLKEKIESSNILPDLNNLREEVVEQINRNPELLKLWQDKYWSLKKCPTCGHIKE